MISSVSVCSSSHVAAFSCELFFPLRTRQQLRYFCASDYSEFIYQPITQFHTALTFSRSFLEVKFAVSVWDGSKKIRRGSLNAAQRGVIFFPSGWNSEGKKPENPSFLQKRHLRLQFSCGIWNRQLLYGILYCDRRRGKLYSWFCKSRLMHSDF